jgi:hypothetical protein
VNKLRDSLGWLIVSGALYITTSEFRKTLTALIELGLATSNNEEAHKLADPVGYFRMKQENSE